MRKITSLLIHTQTRPPHYRLIGFLIFTFIGYGVLVAKLYHEQVKMYDLRTEKVDRQSIRTVRQPARRGRIYDRSGNLLADTIPSYNIALHIGSMLKSTRTKTVDNVVQAISLLNTKLNHQITITRNEIIKHLNRSPALPIVLYQGLSTEEMATILELPQQIAGLEIIAAPMRHYPHNQLASHILGWVGKSDPALAEDRKDYFYYQSDLVGREALEKNLDTNIFINGKTIDGLRGEAGQSLIVVNNRGYKVETLETEKQVKDGNNVFLTLDLRAQAIAENLLKDYKSAFVVMDVETGELLTLVSTPTYNLNECVPFLSADYYKKLLEDPARPLRSRALMEQNMPGSVIKPLIALAQMKKFASNTTEQCMGYVIIGNSIVKCTGHHGHVDVQRALKVSCNSFFMYRGMEIGIESIRDMFKSAKLGEIVPNFPLKMVRGTMPNREEKKRRTGLSWTPHDTALVSIGQGIIDVTPLQMALVMSAIANGGVGYAPQLIKQVNNPQGKTLATNARIPYILLDTTDFPLAIVKEGMKEVVQRGGTGFRAQCTTAELFGKTGTAEIGLGTEASPRRKNTWFTGFAKHKNGKTYAFASLIENGVAGGLTNAPIVAEFFNTWEVAF